MLLLLLAAAGNADLPLSRNLLRISLLLMAAAMWLWFYRPSLAVLIVFLLLSLLVVASSGQLWRTGKEFETVQMAYILICAAGGFWLGGALAGSGMVLFCSVSILIVWRLLKS